MSDVVSEPDLLKTLMVNLFAGAGAGKSTTAAGVFTILKLHDVNCELITEYAKQLAWQGTLHTKRHDGYIFGKQAQRQHVPFGEVEVMITDSPLPLSIVYDEKNNTAFHKYVMSEFNRYDNINYFIERRKAYLRKGRHETENMAKEIDDKTIQVLHDQHIPYTILEGTYEAPNIIAEHILKQLNVKQRYKIDRRN